MFLKTLLVLCVTFRGGIGKGLFGDFKGCMMPCCEELRGQ